MKATHLFCLSLAIAAAGALLAQGPLTPPPSYDARLGPVHAVDGAGLPQPTMKTLHQVEPRTPLAAGQPGVIAEANGGFTINIPGSYFLTANISVPSGNGITILADRVTLDLNGFTIGSYSGDPGGIGIEVQGYHPGLVVRNGFIQAGTTEAGSVYTRRGFTGGIIAETFGPAGSAYSATIEDIQVRGIAGRGFFVIGGNYSGCVADVCADCGISGSSATGCQASRCLYCGLQADLATNCEAVLNAGEGMDVTTAQNCVASYNTGSGIRAINATGCHSRSNGSFGIVGQTVTDSAATDNSGTGIWTVHAQGCVVNSNDGMGIFCETATDCSAELSTLTGIRAEKATDCIAVGGLGHGFEATIVEGCLAEDNALNGFNLFPGTVVPAVRGLNFTALNCVARDNGQIGFAVGGGTIRNCTASSNEQGIWSQEAVVAEGCAAIGNSLGGINFYYANNGGTIVTHCTVNNGGGIIAEVISHSNVRGYAAGIGIWGKNVSFCVSSDNQTNYALQSGGVSNFNN